MRILVIGAGGMLGHDVVTACNEGGMAVAARTRTELDVTDADSVERAVVAERPDVVVNCAAYTDVDGAESDFETACAVNGTGAGNVARAAARAGARVIYPSTDYVFDGDKREPYVESDATGPRSAYGRSKLAGESETRAAAPRHLIVRTSWLFGVAGRNFVETMLRLGAERDEVDVVADQTGCPTSTEQLALALLDVAARGLTGTVHLAGGGHCSWAEFATEIFRQAGVDCTVRPCTTAEFPRPARRPPWSVLASQRGDAPSLPPWQSGLGAYLERRAALTG